jgi:ferric-dicitrate binding protein FerR (iron transport regulator)
MKFSLSEVEELLPLYLSGDLSDKERTMIDEWRKESPENESVYQESCRAWEVIPLLNEMEQFNSIEALKKVNKRLIKADNSGWWTIIQRIAAILLLPVLVFSGYQTIQNFTLKNQQEESVVMQTVSSRQGMVAEFSLPDGTKVWLNSGSELQFPVQFQSGLREVNLKGEAFFEVVKNVKQPFRVNTRELNIDVLGTSFNVISYEDEIQTEVILIEGKVVLSSGEGKVIKEFGGLEPGQRAIYTEESQTVNIEEVNTEKYIAWLDGNLVFQDDSMEDVVKRLDRWFNIEIVIEDSEINEYIYKATFRNENLKQVLDLLKLSAPIDYRIVESKALPDGEFTKRKIYLMNKNK